MDEMLRIIEDAIGLDEGELEMDTNLEDVEEWDSIASLALMAEAKQRWNKKLTAETVRGFKTPRDICACLSE